MNITEWNSITTDMALIETNGSKGAELSICRCYRYSLWRLWDTSIPSVLFIGLNPSTADEHEDDPTLSKCMQYAANWGYGGVYIANLFAFVRLNQGTYSKQMTLLGIKMMTGLYA